MIAYLQLHKGYALKSEKEILQNVFRNVSLNYILFCTFQFLVT